MAAIRDTVFTDGEIRGLIAHATYQAQYQLERNRQELSTTFTKFATALQQLVNERNALKGAPDAGITLDTQDEGRGEESPSPARRKRLRGE